MTIDWDKPLECEHGEIYYAHPIPKSNSTTPYYWVVMDCSLDGLQGASWTVMGDGTPIDPWMPRVYNAKRKPKEGEWWLVQSISGKVTAMFYKGGIKPWNSAENEFCEGCKYKEFAPIEPLIKDPSFKE